MSRNLSAMPAAGITQPDHRAEKWCVLCGHTVKASGGSQKELKRNLIAKWDLHLFDCPERQGDS